MRSSRPIPWSRSYLDSQIRYWVQLKLSLLMVSEQATLEYHVRTCLRDLCDEFHVSPQMDQGNDYRHYKEQLLTLLLKNDDVGFLPKRGSVSCPASGASEFVAGGKNQLHRKIPADDEWIRMLSQWLRVNKTNVMDRQLYYILAVDGFGGFQPGDLKKYVCNLIGPFRKKYEFHMEAVRNMYRWMDANEKVSHLQGPDSACILFWAFLNRYLQCLMLDDQTTLQMQQVKTWVEGYLHKQSMYYKDILNVDEKCLEEMMKVYEGSFLKEDDWKSVAEEQIMLLVKNWTNKRNKTS